MKQNKTYSAFSQIVKIWFHEYKTIFNDAGVITLFVVAVLIYPILYTLAYNNEIVKEVPIVIVDEDDSEMSRKLVSMISATEEVKVLLKTPDYYEGILLFDKSKAYGVIVIPEDFQQKIYQFQSATVSVYADASYMIIYKQIMTAANYAIGTMGAGIEVQRRISKQQQLQQAISERDLLPLEVYSLYNPKGGYATYLMPAVFLLILQQTLLLGISLIGGTLHEKGHDDLLVQTASKKGGAIAIVLGKSLAYYSIYLINALYIIVIVMWLFELPMHANYFELFVFLTPFLFAVIYLSISVSTLFKKREHGLMVLLFTSIPFIFLTGFSWPTEAIPAWQNYLAQLIPSTPAIKGFQAMSQRYASFSQVSQHWVHIWALVLIYFALASLSMKILISRRLKK